MAMRWTSVTAALGLAMVAPASALGAGGPVPPLQGGSGIKVPGSPFRYVAVAAGRETVIKRLGADGARAATAIRVSGRYGIPGVAYNGQTTGLSADGRTLVLAEIQGSFPPRTTRLLVVATRRLAVRTRITLRGWSVVDAISPDGRWVYLIHYPSADISRYEVLAYDMLTRHLLAKPIVDPHDGDEPMTGFAVTRVMSADSRWAYTLYMRPSGAPFIHALDTVGVRAVCVDLPSSLASIDIGNANLTLGTGGTTIRIVADGVTQAMVNTRTFVVARGAFAAALVSTVRPVAHAASTGGAGGLPWEIVAAAAALAVFGGVVRLRTRLRTG
jgi:hypothetical protein